MSENGKPPGGDSPAGVAAADAGPARLLGELAGLRRQARTRRHAYWLPLLLFGLLIAASAPLYVQELDSMPASGAMSLPAPQLTGLGGLQSAYVPVYWLFALTGGYWLTYAWYRRHARKVGLVTSARGFLITGVVITAVAILAFTVPWLGLRILPGDLFIRGTFPFLIIAAGLWVLARAERSWALAVIAALYTAAAVLVSLYNVENILFRLGWNPSQGEWGLTALPGVLLPAVILLAAGLGALAARWRQARQQRAGS
jgi:hypothetical protein